MLRIGTCSWKYDSWIPIVYPENTPTSEMLQIYTAQFTTVEIDQWFWSLFVGKDPVLPKKKDVLHYASNLPENFRFTVKAPNSLTLTHFYKRGNNPLEVNPHFFSNDLLQKFIETLLPLKPYLGSIMFQFEYLNKQKCSGQGEFLDRLSQFSQSLPAEFPFAVEVRNPNFMNTHFFEQLSQLNLTPVFLHGYYMPPVTDMFEKFHSLIGKSLIIRLHGPDRNGIEERTGSIWNRRIEPKDDELKSISQWIQFFIEKETDIYVNVNNHFEGSAPLTINCLKKILNIS